MEIILDDGRRFTGTSEEVPTVLDEEERLKAESLSRPVIAEVAKEVVRENVHVITGEQFLKLQADRIKEHNLKVKLNTERKRKNYEKYV